MAVQINEKTEVTVPLKLLISIVGVIVISSWYVFTTQNRIKELEHSVKIIEERFVSYTKQPGRHTTDVELLKKDMEHLRKQVEKGLK
jgi:predicted membrane-bound dolichyl-phosphate-mannose-protein mannosyltransferase